MLHIEKLTYSYGEDFVFDEASLKLKEGKIYWLKGPNGSGKTTFFRILAGLNNHEFDNSANELVCSLKGEMLNNKELKNKLVYIPNTPYLFDYLNAGDNIEYLVALYELSDQRDLIKNYIKRLNLEAPSDQLVKSYSTGMRAKLFFSTMLCVERPLFLVDELISNLDKEAVVELFEIFKELTTVGKTIVFTSHVKFMADIEADISFIDIEDNGFKVSDGSGGG